MWPRWEASPRKLVVSTRRSEVSCFGMLLKLTVSKCALIGGRVSHLLHHESKWPLRPCHQERAREGIVTFQPCEDRSKPKTGRWSVLEVLRRGRRCELGIYPRDRICV